MMRARIPDFCSIGNDFSRAEDGCIEEGKVTQAIGEGYDPTGCVRSEDVVPGELSLSLIQSHVNTFVIHTVRLLNNFSAICEQKILNVHQRLSRLDATLTLLESRLQSVEGLDRLDRLAVVQSQESELPLPTLTSSTQLLDQEIDEAGSTSSIGVSQNLVESAHQVGDISDTSLATKDQPTILKVKDDPRYARFFRMLQVGVPGAAVKIQMSAEGLDASLLDTPDAPSS